MHEIFPVAAGILTGLVASRLSSVRARILLIAPLSVVFGFLATVISGEFKIGWEFLYADIPIVAGSATGALAAVYAYRRFTGGVRP